MKTNPTSHKASRDKKGFSLLEMLIYITILVFMLVIILEVVLSIARSERIIKSVRHIENSSILSLERISREVRQADSIDQGASILGSNPSKLVLIGVDQVGNPRTVEFSLSGGRLWLKENGVDRGALSESQASIKRMVFYRFATSTSEGIKTEITIESGTSTYYKVENFYSSTLLR